MQSDVNDLWTVSKRSLALSIYKQRILSCTDDNY